MRLHKQRELDPNAAVRNRGRVIFDNEDRRVTDDRDHFELNTVGQARNALARAGAFTESPSWFSGSLRSFHTAVLRAVEREYPSVDTSGFRAAHGFVEKNLADVGMVTESVNGHAHAIRIFAGPEDGPRVVGETSYSTGDAESEEPHAHAFTLDLDSGRLEIAEADGHTHSVPSDALASAMARVREERARDLPESEPMVRSARRQLSNASVGFVSLCRRGMNGIRTLLKSDGRFSLSTSLSKMDEEGLLHALVWVPGLPCHEGDVMTADEVRKMAHGFLPNGGNIDVEHDGRPLTSDQVSIAEHYIVPPGDPKFKGILTSEGDEVDPTGGWGLILKIHDPEKRAGYRSGEWNGVSLAGRAEVTPLDKSKHSDNEDEFDMTPEERKEFAKEIAASLSEILKTAAPAAPAAPEPTETESVDLPEDLDVNDPEALEKWMDELFVRSLDLTKREDVAKLAKHRREQAAKLAKAKPRPAEEPDGRDELAEARAEMEKLQARVEKLQKGSRQSQNDPEPGKQKKYKGMTDKEIEQHEMGLQIAKMLAS